jgi:hypothetical protein
MRAVASSRIWWLRSKQIRMPAGDQVAQPECQAPGQPAGARGRAARERPVGAEQARELVGVHGAVVSASSARSASAGVLCRWNA